jgi:PKD repeat protein
MPKFRVLIILVLGSVLSGCGGGGGSSAAAAPPVNSAPRAIITIAKTTGYAPLTLAFDGSGSTDSDGTISEYLWDFDDGFTSQSASVDHIFSDLGSYTVVLTVTDDDGATSSTQVNIDIHAQAAGFYLGILDSTTTGISQQIDAHIGSNYKYFGRGFPQSCVTTTVYAGTLMIDETSADATLLADTRDDFCVFPDGSTLGNVDVSASIAARSAITAVYSGVGDIGTIELSYIPEISDRVPTLAGIAGVWTDSDGLGFTETMTIQPDGQFAVSDSDGCNYSGTLSLIDPNLNEFEIIYDLFCPPGVNAAGDGQRVGLAFVDDFFFSEEWFVWRIIFQDGPLAGRQGGGALSRPRGVAAGGIAEQSKVTRQDMDRPRSGRLR